MAEATNEFMTAAPSTGDAFEMLEAGAYEAVCVGLTKREFKKYQSDELEPKFQFVFQVVDGDVKHYLRTLPMRNCINEKSNLFLFLNSWTGVSLEKCANGIDMGKLVGVKAQVVVGEGEREGKKYNTIETVLKAKKSSTVTFIKDDKAPAFLNKNLLASHWIDGIGFAEASSPKVEFTDDDLVKYADSKASSAPKKVSGQEFLDNNEDETPLPF